MTLIQLQSENEAMVCFKSPGTHQGKSFAVGIVPSLYQKSCQLCFTETDRRRSMLISDCRREEGGLNTKQLEETSGKMGRSEEALCQIRLSWVGQVSPWLIAGIAILTSTVGDLQFVDQALARANRGYTISKFNAFGKFERCLMEYLI